MGLKLPIPAIAVPDSTNRATYDVTERSPNSPGSVSVVGRDGCVSWETSRPDDASHWPAEKQRQWSDCSHGQNHIIQLPNLFCT